LTVETVKVKRYTCDGCGEATIEEDDALPHGYHGTVIVATSLGASKKLDWYACTDTHVMNAIEGVIASEEKT
jgi:hypothetical protein